MCIIYKKKVQIYQHGHDFVVERLIDRILFQQSVPGEEIFNSKERLIIRISMCYDLCLLKNIFLRRQINDMQ